MNVYGSRYLEMKFESDQSVMDKGYYATFLSSSHISSVDTVWPITSTNTINNIKFQQQHASSVTPASANQSTPLPYYCRPIKDLHCPQNCFHGHVTDSRACPTCQCTRSNQGKYGITFPCWGQFTFLPGHSLLFRKCYFLTTSLTVYMCPARSINKLVKLWVYFHTSKYAGLQHSF